MSISRKYYMWIIISLIVLGSILVWDYYQPSLAESEPLNGVPILTYHKVNPDRKSGGFGMRVRPADFDWEMRYLKNHGYQTVSLSDVVDHFQTGRRLPDKPVVLTFDDAYQDNYRYARPILQKYGFTATIFVIPNIVGDSNRFDYDAKIQPENRMMTWKEIMEMNAHGFTIGAHTLDHVHLTEVDPIEAQRQIVESKKILEKKLGQEILYFCYPYGNYNRDVAQMVKASGFRAATSSDDGLVQSDMNPYLLKRIRINGYLNHRQFVNKLHKHYIPRSTTCGMGL